jgi:hypothetical protein
MVPDNESPSEASNVKEFLSHLENIISNIPYVPLIRYFDILTTATDEMIYESPDLPPAERQEHPGYLAEHAFGIIPKLMQVQLLSDHEF